MILRMLLSATIGAVMALLLGWAFGWSDRQVTVVGVVLTFFVSMLVSMSHLLERLR